MTCVGKRQLCIRKMKDPTVSNGARLVVVLLLEALRPGLDPDEEEY